MPGSRPPNSEPRVGASGPGPGAPTAPTAATRGPSAQPAADRQPAARLAVPQPAPAGSGARRPPDPADQRAEEWDDDLNREFTSETANRWVSMANVVGSGLVAVVALQVVAALIEGLTYGTNEPQQVATGDIFHRLGYPFGSLGTTTLIILVLGVVLLSLPSYLGDETTPSQDRLAALALIGAVIAAVILALGSLLAVRANFHVYNESQRSVPTYVIVQYASFMIGNLGAAVLAFYASMQVMGMNAHR